MKERERERDREEESILWMKEAEKLFIANKLVPYFPLVLGAIFRLEN